MPDQVIKSFDAENNEGNYFAAYLRRTFYLKSFYNLAILVTNWYELKFLEQDLDITLEQTHKTNICMNYGQLFQV